MKRCFVYVCNFSVIEKLKYSLDKIIMVIHMPRKKEEITGDSPIEKLRGVGNVLKEKLNEAGIYTIRDLAGLDPFTLAELAQISEIKAQNLIREAIRIAGHQIMTAKQYLEIRRTIDRITTGSVLLDDLLGGGLETQAVTEFFGQFGSGKTQVGHQLSVNVQLPKEKGGLEGKVVYIDTENTFRPERIVQMAKAVGLDPEKVLDNIYYLRPKSVNQQVAYNDIIREMLQSGENIRLIVIDSLMALFRSEYIGRGMLSERQQILSKYLADLHDIAESFNVAIYVTNQVQSDPGVFYGNPEKPIGGNVLGHSSTYRVYLRKGSKGKRIARMVDAPNLPERDVPFLITEEGIRDDPEALKKFMKMKEKMNSESHDGEENNTIEDI